MLTFLIGSIDEPRYAVRTSSRGLYASELPIGIQTRVNDALCTHGALTSPVLALPHRCEAKPQVRKSRQRCQLDAGHDGPHSFPA